MRAPLAGLAVHRPLTLGQPRRDLRRVAQPRTCSQGRWVAGASKKAVGHYTQVSHHCQVPPTQTRTQTQAEACEWSMVCAHHSDLGESRPAGDIAGQPSAVPQASAYTQGQLHSLYVSGSSRAQGPQHMTRLLQVLLERWRQGGWLCRGKRAVEAHQTQHTLNGGWVMHYAYAHILELCQDRKACHVPSDA
jgi:hypothetical protein